MPVGLASHEAGDLSQKTRIENPVTRVVTLVIRILTKIPSYLGSWA